MLWCGFGSVGFGSVSVCNQSPVFGCKKTLEIREGDPYVGVVSDRRNQGSMVERENTKAYPPRCRKLKTNRERVWTFVKKIDKTCFLLLNSVFFARFYYTIPVSGTHIEKKKQVGVAIFSCFFLFFVFHPRDRKLVFLLLFFCILPVEGRQRYSIPW